jgi:hypothetical protein
MSAIPRSLARDKELLLMRSALCRLRLARDSMALRESLDWRRGLRAAVTQPAARQVAFGAALTVLGLARAARLLVLAGRVVLAVKVVRTLLSYVRPAGAPGSVRYRTDSARDSP